VSSGRTLRTAGVISNGGSIILAGGLLDGNGSVVNGFGGIMRGAGGVSVPVTNSGGIIRADSSGSKLTVVDLSGGNTAGGQLQVYDNCTLAVNSAFGSDGTIWLNGPQAVLCGGTITNTGTIRGQGTIANTVHNAGVIRAEGGQLGLSAADVTNLATGEIQSAAGTAVFFAQGLPSNAGAICLAGGTLDTNHRAMTNAVDTGRILGYGTITTSGLTNNGLISLADGASNIYGPVTNNHQVQLMQANVTFYGPVVNAVKGVFEVTGGRTRFLDTFVNEGTFTQTDGDDYVQQTLSIATESNSVAVYNLCGGTLFAGRIEVGGSASGPGGTGTFSISGGYAVVDDELAVWTGSTVELGLGALVCSDGDHPGLDLLNDGTVEVGDGNGSPVVYCLGAVNGNGDIVIGPGATLWVESLRQNSVRIYAGGTLVLAGQDPQLYAETARQNYEMAIPEPATLAMMGLGGLVVGAVRRRRPAR